MRYYRTKAAQLLWSTLFLSIAMCFSITANATPVVWTLSGATFDDGGAASGSFTYDADTNTYSAIAITTTAGGILPGASYDEVGHSLNANFVYVVRSADGPDYTGDPVVGLSFGIMLTNSGGTVSLFNLRENVCFNADCSGTDSTGLFRSIATGSVTAPLSASPEATPVPSLPQWALITLVMLLAGIVFVRRKQLS